MNQELLEKIFSHYNVASPTAFSKIEKGFISHNHKVQTSDGAFFLKQHAPEKVWQIDSIEEIEMFFANNGIPVISPFKTKEGNYHVIVDEGYYVLYPFVAGKHYERGDIPEVALKSMGELLARIHLLTKDGIKGEYKEFAYYKVRDKDKVFAELEEYVSIINAKAQKSAFDVRVLEVIELRKKMIEECKVTFDSLDLKDRHLCHGDYHADNMFFNDDGTISHLFDFDMTGPAPRMYEVVRSFMLSCFNNIYTKGRTEQAKIFISAYHRKYPFTEKQFRDAFEAYYIKQFWATWIEKAHYEQEITRTDVLYEPTVDTILYLRDNRETLFQELSGSLFR